MQFPNKLIAITLIYAIAFLGIAYTSCKKENKCPTCAHGGVCKNDTCSCPAGYAGTNCKYPLCYNGGICDSLTDSCTCPLGYEGNNCETISRDKFTQDWTVSEKGSTTTDTKYGVSVQPGAGITGVLILNFNNYFIAAIKGYVSGDSLYIPNQQLEGKTVFGNGTISPSTTYTNGSISLRYEVIDSITSQVDDYGYYPPDGSTPSVWNR